MLASEINPLTFWRFIERYLVWSPPLNGIAFQAAEIAGMGGVLQPLHWKVEKLFPLHIADCHKILLCYFPTADPVSSWGGKNSIN